MGPLVREPVEMHGVQQVGGAGRPLAPRHLAQLQRQLDVLLRGQPWKERRLLEEQRRLLTDLDRAGGGPVEPGDEVQQRRLAATRRADEADELARGDVERDVVEREGVRACGAVHLRHLAHPDCGLVQVPERSGCR